MCERRFGGSDVAEQILPARIELHERPAAHLADERVGQRFVKEAARARSAGADPAVHARPRKARCAEFETQVPAFIDVDQVEAEQGPGSQQVLFRDRSVGDPQPLVELGADIELERPLVAGVYDDVDFGLRNRNRVDVGVRDERQGSEDPRRLLDEEGVEAVFLREEQLVADQARPGSTVDPAGDPVRESADPIDRLPGVGRRRVDRVVVDEDLADDGPVAGVVARRGADFLRRRAGRAADEGRREDRRSRPAQRGGPPRRPPDGERFPPRVARATGSPFEAGPSECRIHDL